MLAHELTKQCTEQQHQEQGKNIGLLDGPAGEIGLVYDPKHDGTQNVNHQNQHTHHTKGHPWEHVVLLRRSLVYGEGGDKADPSEGATDHGGGEGKAADVRVEELEVV